MIWKYERICDYNILTSSSSKHNDLRDILWRQRLTATTL